MASHCREAANLFLVPVRVQPIRFRNWEIIVDFRVSGKGKDLFGDGMAFWYARDPLRPG